MSLETAEADVACLAEERGPQFLLNRYGITVDDIEHLAFMTGDNLDKTTLVLHGCLLGLALAEIRAKETDEAST